MFWGAVGGLVAAGIFVATAELLTPPRPTKMVPQPGVYGTVKIGSYVTR